MAALLFPALSKQYEAAFWEDHTRENHKVVTAHQILVSTHTEQRSVQPSCNLIMEGGPFPGPQNLPLGFPGDVVCLVTK